VARGPQAETEWERGGTHDRETTFRIGELPGLPGRAAGVFFVGSNSSDPASASRHFGRPVVAPIVDG